MLQVQDQYRINFVDSAASNRMKTGTGAGESRLYLGQMSKKDAIYSFFSSDVRFYFACKNEMLRYLRIAEYEYLHPTQNYVNKASFPSYFTENQQEIENLDSDYIRFNFVENHDSSRCFIRNSEGADSYEFLRKICIPVYTKLVFVKYYDSVTHNSYIKIMPTFNKHYTEEELGKILADRYNKEASPKKTAIYLFAFDFAEQIIEDNLNTTAIVRFAGIGDSYRIELDNAIAIYKKMRENNQSISGLETVILDTISDGSNISIPQPTDTEEIAEFYRPYITAIKSKPFLLLAGISGTGKSRIVRELARACWEDGSEEYKAHKPSNFEMVQVKPNWHDSSELIGYVSRVSGEPVYVAGPFLKFIARAWENPEVPYFLCLDEMNLAPVEQYFAEYLSVIESRKAENGVVNTDPIIEKVPEQWYFDLVGKLTEVGEVQDRFKAEGITIPQNLIVVGTVNMDETTFSFSRKVLDRAMTIEMNEVDLYGGLDSHHETIGHLTKEHLIGTAVEGVDVYDAYKSQCDIAIDFLKAINEKLEGTPFKVAYRTRNEFLLYVVNNLPYAGALESEMVYTAIDEITCMKVLSRIEGDETKVTKALLDDLKQVFMEKIYEGWDENEALRESVSLRKLKEMSKRLESGYTSFWS